MPVAAYWMTREKIRPMEENPASRFVRWVYAGRLRLALRRKALMLSLPLVVLVLGLGAWIGLPTVLLPVEKVFADEPAVQIRQGRDTVGALRCPVGMVPKDKGSLAFGFLEDGH